jgi:hypothetical protein
VNARASPTLLSPRVIGLLLLPALVLYVPWALDKTATFDVLPPLAFAALVHAACLLGGYALVHRFFGSLPRDGLEQVALGWALGAGTLGTGMTLLGLLGLFNVATAGTLLGAIAIVPLAGVRPPRPSLQEVPALPVAIAAVVSSGALLLALAPPLFHDTLTYHLALPMHAAATGALEVSATDVFSAYPMLGEMTSSPSLLLGSPIAMAVTHAGFLFPLVLLAAAFARRFLEDTGAGVAIVLGTCPLLLFVATTIKPDLLQTLFALAALFALASLLHVGKELDDDALRAHVRFVGACVGLMCATRVTALAWGTLLLIALLAALHRHVLDTPAPAATLKRWAPAVGLATLVGGPVYVRNLIALGNPVYPLASSIFGGPAWMPKTAALLDGMARRVDGGSAVDLVLLGPLTFTFDNAGSMNDIPGTLPLLFLPFALLLRGWPRALKLLALLALASLPIWWGTHALMRLNPLLVLGVMMSTGWVVGRLLSTSVRPLVVAVVVCLVAGNLLWTLRADAFLRRDPWAALTRELTPEEHLKKHYELYGAFAWLNAHSPPSARVLLFTGDWRSAYLERRVLRSGRLTPPVLQTVLQRALTVDEVDAALRELEIDYLVLTPSAVRIEQEAGWMDVGPEKLALLDAFIKAHAPASYSDPFAQVIALGPP